MHARQQIRQAAVALITGLTTTGTRVYDSRFFELEATQVPAWAVYTTEEAEESEISAMGGQLERVCNLSFVGLARALTGTALQTTLDTMAEELEEVVLRNSITGAELILSGTEWEFDTEESDAAEGKVTLTYACRYYTNQGAPAALI